MRALAGEKISTLVVRYDPNGSLVTTHKEQGSDLGLYGGILGWTPDDPRLPTYERALKDEGIEIDLHYESYNASSPQLLPPRSARRIGKNLSFRRYLNRRRNDRNHLYRRYSLQLSR